MQKSLLFSLLICSAVLLQAQIELRGVVIDAKTKEPLPYVNYSISSSAGGMTDDSGRFEMTVSAKTDSVIFSYLGYKDEILRKRFFKKDSIIVRMNLESFMLEEFTVKAKKTKIPKDTVAIRIYRNVVKHKPDNRPRSYDSYAYEEYQKSLVSLYNVSSKLTKRKILKPFRFILENQDSTADGKRFVPLILKETLTDHYYNRDPKKNKSVVKASKISGIEQLRFSELLDVAFDEVEVYDNQAEVNGKTFVLPFAEGALALYNYYLIDSVKGPDSIWRFNLAFTPKSKADLLFNGQAMIQDSTFAILKIDLGLDRRSNINFISDFSLKQGFANTGNGWFKNEESRSTDVSITRRKKAKSIRIARYLHRSNIQTDSPIADTILEKENVVFLKDYRKKTDSFWVASRHDTLTLQESKVYGMIDSLKRTRFYKAMSTMGSLFASGHYKTKTLEYGNLYQLVSFNDLEGVRLRVNVRNNWRIGKWVNFKVYGAYGVKDKRFKYGLDISSFLPDPKNKMHKIGASYRDDYQRFTLNSNFLDFDYIYVSLLRRSPINDLVYLRDAKLFYAREWVPNFTTNVMLNYKEYKTIPGKIEFIKTDENTGIKDTTRSFRVFSPSLTITATPGAKFLETGNRKIFLKGKLPRITFTYAFSAQKMGSDFNYHKMDLLIEERLPSPIGFTFLQLSASKLFGSAPYPLLTIHPGNQSFLYDFKRFSNMRESEFISDQSITFLIEHHFDGFFFNKIPGWKKLGLREVFTAKIAASSLNRKNVTFSDLPPNLYALNGFYAEVGFGIENILKLVRVDFSWRLTQLDLPGASKFMWKLSFTPRF